MQTVFKQTVRQTVGGKRLRWYWLWTILFACSAWVQSAEPIRVGIVSIDNYQALAFTELFHHPPADNPALRGLKVVAAWPGGSPDLQESFTNVPRWKPLLQKQGVRMEETIDAVLDQVDAVMLMTVDGRPHLAQVRPVLKARKPVYIGRPMAASLEDVIEMFHLPDATRLRSFPVPSIALVPVLRRCAATPTSER